MKKSIYFFITIIFALFMLFLQTNIVSAASLDNIEVTTDKNKVIPGGEVTVTVDFGQELGAYTVDVAYDNNLFDYVRTEGGTANDNGTRVRVVYPSDVGAAARRTTKVTFKAKEDIVTSNPTDFAIAIEGAANSDASETYDDITIPIGKDVLVEPDYVNYNLTLEYTGTIEPKVAKNMKLITSSSMGKNYDHVRLTAEVTKEPSDAATTKLIAIDGNSQAIDLIQNGWGEADGYSIGGKNVRQQLNLQGEFSEVGDYTVHVKLIDRDNSDSIIAEKSFNFKVAEKQTQQNPEATEPSDTDISKKEEEELPDNLPKTGTTQYVFISFVIAVLAISYYFITKKNNKK